MDNIKNGRKFDKRFFSFTIPVIILLLLPSICYGVLNIFAYFGHSWFYQKTEKEYAVTAENYVRENYGDHYYIASSHGVYSGTAIIGDAFQGIDFEFEDASGNDKPFTVQIGYGDNCIIVKSDTHSF